MNNFLRVVLAMTVGACGAALAGPGHDHGDTATLPAAGLPRFAAASELFELVGVLDGTRLTFFLDRSDTNAPVDKAKLDVEFAGAKLALSERAPGEFEAMLPVRPKAGTIPVTATIEAGSDTDLLAGELVLHEPHADEKTTLPHSWSRSLSWVLGGGGVLALVAFGAVALRRRRAGGAA